MSRYDATVAWQRGAQPFTDNRYSRAHEWAFDGGARVPASSSPLSVPAPLSDPAGSDGKIALTRITLRPQPDGLNACHIPFEIAAASAAAPHGTLRGHIARNNPLWRNASAALDALVVFQGPQAYITPSWYEEKKASGKAVPTYDYATVHAYGPLRIIDDAVWLRTLLERLTNRHEASRAEPWQISDAPPDYIEKMLAAIIGIEIPLRRVIGSWKASQNRSAVDRSTIAAGLRASGDADAQAMAKLVAD